MTDQIKTITQDDLHRLQAEGKRVEVENGIIVEVAPVTNFHLMIIRTLFRILDAHVMANALGDVYMDGFRYVLFGERNDIQTDYIPDLSFLRKNRIPTDYDYNNDFPGAPDLAVDRFAGTRTGLHA
jgi:Uma2 family endonuclease